MRFLCKDSEEKCAPPLMPAALFRVTAWATITTAFKIPLFNVSIPFRIPTCNPLTLNAPQTESVPFSNTKSTDFFNVKCRYGKSHLKGDFYSSRGMKNRKLKVQP